MFDLLKTQWIGILAIAIAVIGFSGGTSSMLGSDATTITNPWTFAEPKGTTTVTIQSTDVGGCLAIEKEGGTGFGYFTADATGSLATTTADGC